MKNNEINRGRRRILTGATCVVGAAGAAGVAVPFVRSWNPNAKAKAAGAPVKVNVSKLEPGEKITVKWRGRPVYVVRRTAETLDNLNKITSRLADPESENSVQPDYVDPKNRALKPEYLVVVGLCTHLGCAPTYRPEVGVNPATNEADDRWLGGFFCPCHGSIFDLAGRVYQGVPAPKNLVVPPYFFESDNILIIGTDQEVA